MREIKFRAWKIADGHEMFDDIAFIDWNKSIVGVNYPISSTNTRLDKEPLDNVVLEQYTGLKDKNGVDIYENDVVKTSGVNIYVVEFFDGKFNPVSDLEGSNWEVIGNIHQDSDLLVDDIERMIPDDIGNDIHELHGGDK